MTRGIILSEGMKESLKNLKGVIFIGSPLKGSTLRSQINLDLNGMIPVFNFFMSGTYNCAIVDHEYIKHFLESGL